MIDLPTFKTTLLVACCALLLVRLISSSPMSELSSAPRADPLVHLVLTKSDVILKEGRISYSGHEQRGDGD